MAFAERIEPVRTAAAGRRLGYTHRRSSRPADRDRLHDGSSRKGGRAAEGAGRAIEPTSRERGYINYDLHESIEHPGLFIFYENWESAEHLDAHLEAPHLVDFAARSGDLLDDTGLTIRRVRRIA
jgi:quinol monooxygenase YgiN